jgi:hypothetical protein
MQGLQLIRLHRIIVFLKYPYLALSCKKALYFEHYLSLNVDKVSKKGKDPPSAVDGFEGINKRVGGKSKDPWSAFHKSLVSIDLWILGRWLQINYA